MLPNDILYRQKMGFAVPLATWFRGPLRQRVRDAVLGERLADSGLFNPATLRRLVDQHQSGMRDHSAPLWSLLMFEAFLRTSGARVRGDSAQGQCMSRDAPPADLHFALSERRRGRGMGSSSSRGCTGCWRAAASRAHVIAPVPWFPFSGERWGEYGRMAATPRREVRERYRGAVTRATRCLPKVGMAFQPRGHGARGRCAKSNRGRGARRIDLIDAHYLYPDGVAAAAIARRIGRPLVSDGPRHRCQRDRADAGTASTHPGGDRGFGRRDRRVGRLEGVAWLDLAPRRSESRSFVMASTQNCSVRKTAPRRAASLGFLTAARTLLRASAIWSRASATTWRCEAAAQIEGTHLLFVGRGSERPRLERLASELRVASRIRFLDEMPQERLRWVYSAADVLVLASEREGWPNVLLESAACGTPVVAFNVGGVPEILADRTVGTIVRGAHAPDPLAGAIRSLLVSPPSREAVRAAAIRFSWDPVLEAQLALYRRAAQAGRETIATASTKAVQA